MACVRLAFVEKLDSQQIFIFHKYLLEKIKAYISNHPDQTIFFSEVNTMNTVKCLKKSFIILILLIPALWSMEATAGSVTLSLVRSTLTNVPDAAGIWQHEGGVVRKGAVNVGFYALHRRVTTGGTDKLNTAMTTMTLFLNTAQVANSAPRNVTIEGSWDFNTGRFLGSVSAASSQYNWVQGADVQGAPSTAVGTIGTTNLLIDWLQSPTLTLP